LTISALLELVEECGGDLPFDPCEPCEGGTYPLGSS